MRPLPRSLRGLTIVFLALFLTVTALAGFGTFFATASMVRMLVDERIESESEALVPKGTVPVREELARHIVELNRQRDTGDLGVLLTDARGDRIAGNASFSRELPLGYSSLGRQDRIVGLSAGRVLVREVGGGMRLAVFAETEPVDNYFAMRRRIYLAGFGAIILVVLAGLLAFRRLVGKRIDAVRRTAESIIEGDLTHRVPMPGDEGEFDQQAGAFNRMLDRISLLMGEIRNVSNNISHEMRTPLARLRNELAMLEQSAEAEPLRARLAMAREQADELLGMFAAMLRIAEIENGSRRAGFRSLDLGALAAEIVEMVQPVAEERGQRVLMERADAAPLTGDRQMLSQLLVNMLENAVRHTPRGTRIRVSVARDAQAVVLVVTDDGPGIPAAQRALVMRRFGRVQNAGQGESRNGPQGHGLGLPLAEAIVRLHRGTLVLEDAGPGLRIVVTLPR
ncbi:sensor histidine kinase [Novosphingobium guangzhouense]|uniref:histidine kinase n=1 Tax=Novosphingobium guangzhouense TaxID=1850347 RepID=A0A2K2FVX1_9SPHN|nr:ATP-binding protein [Novosphingobium guangzhouense]PNU02898.1 two-component sensor histidine kinase [Novosphingobium guangzhouense]